MKILVFILAFIMLLSQGAASQGCSDSGFCTMGAFKPDQVYVRKFSLRLNSIELTHHLGHTKYNDWIQSTFLDVNIGLGRKTFLQVRLPAYTTISGNMPTTRGWGDFFISASQAIVIRDDFQVYLSAGAKIYTSRPDQQSENGNPMPMYQQTSYGSNDISLGGSLISRKWLFAIAYQHALNDVENNFTSARWTGSPLYNIVQKYDPSAGLQRGDDIMVRAERNFRLSRFNFHTGILNLYRVTEDKTLSENGELTGVRGSNGLAINIVTGGGYQFNTRMGIRLLVSIKVRERDANPDGLSRNFISQLAYVIRF